MAPKADIYLIDDKHEVLLIERSKGVAYVESVETGTKWHTLFNRLKNKNTTMTPHFVNPHLLNSLPNGKYAIFIDDFLHEVIMIENYDSTQKLFANEMSVINSMVSNEPMKAEEYIATLGDSENVKIVFASKIKL